MSTLASPIVEPAFQATAAWSLPSRGKVGMASLIVAASAIFTIFVVAYLLYVGKSLSGPTPRDVLETCGRESSCGAARASNPGSSRSFSKIGRCRRSRESVMSVLASCAVGSRWPIDSWSLEWS